MTSFSFANIDPKVREVMRGPVITTGVLLCLLAAEVLLAMTTPFPACGYVELGIAAVMVIIVLTFSMELTHAPPLVRLFSILGFFWLAILFGITMIDYLTR
jgi:cytochrome c oxidase subunit 4